jgi:hypothetical protein
MSRQYGFQSGKSLLPICLDMYVLKRIMKMSHYVPQISKLASRPPHPLEGRLYRIFSAEPSSVILEPGL